MSSMIVLRSSMIVLALIGPYRPSGGWAALAAAGRTVGVETPSPPQGMQGQLVKCDSDLQQKLAGAPIPPPPPPRGQDEVQCDFRHCLLFLGTRFGCERRVTPKAKPRTGEKEDVARGYHLVGDSLGTSQEGPPPLVGMEGAQHSAEGNDPSVDVAVSAKENDPPAKDEAAASAGVSSDRAPCAGEEDDAASAGVSSDRAPCAEEEAAASAGVSSDRPPCAEEEGAAYAGVSSDRGPPCAGEDAASAEEHTSEDARAEAALAAQCGLDLLWRGLDTTQFGKAEEEHTGGEDHLLRRNAEEPATGFSAKAKDAPALLTNDPAAQVDVFSTAPIRVSPPRPRLDALPEGHFPLFPHRDWYHFFPVDEEVGPNDVVSVADTFCQDKCASQREDPRYRGECLPKFLDRTLIWNREKDNKVYVVRAGGWFPQSNREVWLDLTAPLQTTAIKVVNGYTHGKALPVVIGYGTAGAGGLTETDVADAVCFRTRSSWHEQHRHWMPEDRHRVLHFISWNARNVNSGRGGFRDRTREEIHEVIRKNYASAATGFDTPVFCEDDVALNAPPALGGADGDDVEQVYWERSFLSTSKVHFHPTDYHVVVDAHDQHQVVESLLHVHRSRPGRLVLVMNDVVGSPVCNAWFVDSHIKSMPHAPHVQIFLLVKGKEPRYYDEPLKTATKLNKTCSWNDMMLGTSGAAGETRVVDAITTCTFGFGLWSALRLIDIDLLATKDPACHAAVAGKGNESEPVCMKQFARALTAENRAHAQWDAVLPLTALVPAAEVALHKDLNKFAVCPAEGDVTDRASYLRFNSFAEYKRLIEERGTGGAPGA